MSLIDILMLIRRQQLRVMMDFAPFARRCKAKYCNNSIPSLSLKPHERKFFDAYFRGRGEGVAKAANVFENASEKGNWEKRGGGGRALN